MFKKNRFCYLLFLLLISSLGCSEPKAEVHGKVLYDGMPLNSGSVILYGPNEQIVRGVILPNGRYSISNVPFGAAKLTVQAHPRMPPGLAQKTNLPPSKNSPHLTLPPMDKPESVVAIPRKYSVVEETPLVLIVGESSIEWDLILQK